MRPSVVGSPRVAHEHRPGTAHTTLLVVVLVLMALYFLLFYAGSLTGPTWQNETGSTIRRGTLVASQLLTFDFHVRSWCGETGTFALTDRLPILLLVAAILAVAVALGSLLLATLNVTHFLTSLEGFLFALGLGLNTLSLYVLAVGLSGGLRKPALFFAPATGVVVLWLCRRYGWPISHRPDSPSATIALGCAADWLDIRWLYLAVPFVLVILWGGMLPPVDFDVREYHLQVPKEFYLEGRISFLPHNVYGNMPLGAEMLSLLSMVVVGDWWWGALVGKALLASFAPLTALALFAAGQRLFSTTAGVVAGLVYLSIPWIVQLSTAGLVEGAYGFYLFLSLYGLILWQRNNAAQKSLQDGPSTNTSDFRGKAIRQPSCGRLLWLAGYLAGSAVAVKYPAALFVVLPFSLWILGRHGKAGGRAFTAFLLAAFLACGLWLTKNWVLAGNPTYPLLYSIFDGKTRTPAKDLQWRTAHHPKHHAASSLYHHVRRVFFTSNWLSPLTVPLATLALLVRREQRLVLSLWGYFLLVVFCWWLLTHRIDRFWIPAMPVLALLAGLGATWTTTRPWRLACGGLLLLTLLSNFFLATCGPGGYNRYFVPYERLRASTERVDPWHLHLNRTLAKGQQVLLVGDAQPFDLEVENLYNTVFDDCLLESLLQGRSPAEVRALLDKSKISHIYVHWGEIHRYRQPHNYGFSDFVQPERFAQWVRAGVLRREPPQSDTDSGVLYVVLPGSSTKNLTAPLPGLPSKTNHL